MVYVTNIQYNVCVRVRVCVCGGGWGGVNCIRERERLTN